MENAARRILRERRSPIGNNNGGMSMGGSSMSGGTAGVAVGGKKRNTTTAANVRAEEEKLPLAWKHRLSREKIDRKTGGMLSGKLSKSISRMDGDDNDDGDGYGDATTKEKKAQPPADNDGVLENDGNEETIMNSNSTTEDNGSLSAAKEECYTFKPISQSRSPSPPSLSVHERHDDQYGNGNGKHNQQPPNFDSSGQRHQSHSMMESHGQQLNNQLPQHSSMNDGNNNPKENWMNEISYEDPCHLVENGGYSQLQKYGYNYDGSQAAPAAVQAGYDYFSDEENDVDDDCYQEGDWGDNIEGQHFNQQYPYEGQIYDPPLTMGYASNNETDAEFGDDEGEYFDPHDGEEWGDPYTGFNALNESQFAQNYGNGNVDAYDDKGPGQDEVYHDALITSDGDFGNHENPGNGIAADSTNVTQYTLSNTDSLHSSRGNNFNAPPTWDLKQRANSSSSMEGDAGSIHSRGRDGFNNIVDDYFKRIPTSDVQQWDSPYVDDDNIETFTSDNDDSIWREKAANRKKSPLASTQYITKPAEIDIFAWGDDDASYDGEKSDWEDNTNWEQPREQLSEQQTAASNEILADKLNSSTNSDVPDVSREEEKPLLIMTEEKKKKISKAHSHRHHRLNPFSDGEQSDGGRPFRIFKGKTSPKELFRMRNRAVNKKGESKKYYSEGELSDDENFELERVGSSESTLFGLSFTPIRRKNRSKKNHGSKPSSRKLMSPGERRQVIANSNVDGDTPKNLPGRHSKINENDRKVAILDEATPHHHNHHDSLRDVSKYVDITDDDAKEMDKSHAESSIIFELAGLNESYLTESTQLASNKQKTPPDGLTNQRGLANINGASAHKNEDVEAILSRVTSPRKSLLPPLPPNIKSDTKALPVHANQISLHRTRAYHSKLPESIQQHDTNHQSHTESHHSKLYDDLNTKPEESISTPRHHKRVDRHQTASPVEEIKNASEDECSTVSSFQTDSLGSLVTKDNPNSHKNHSSSKKYFPKSDISTASALSEIERLRRDNDRLRQELENVSHMSSMSSAMPVDNKKHRDVIAAHQSPLSDMLENKNSAHRRRAGMHENHRNNRNPYRAGPLINGADFDDAGSAHDSITTYSLLPTDSNVHFTRDPGCDLRKAPELLKKIAVTTRSVAAHIKTTAQDLNNERKESKAFDGACMRPFDCVSACTRKGRTNGTVVKTAVTRASSITHETKVVLGRAVGCIKKSGTQDNSKPAYFTHAPSFQSTSTGSATDNNSNSFTHKMGQQGASAGDS